MECNTSCIRTYFCQKNRDNRTNSQWHFVGVALFPAMYGRLGCFGLRCLVVLLSLRILAFVIEDPRSSKSCRWAYRFISAIHGRLSTLDALLSLTQPNSVDIYISAMSMGSLGSSLSERGCWEDRIIFQSWICFSFKLMLEEWGATLWSCDCLGPALVIIIQSDDEKWFRTGVPKWRQSLNELRWKNFDISGTIRNQESSQMCKSILFSRATIRTGNVILQSLFKTAKIGF